MTGIRANCFCRRAVWLAVAGLLAVVGAGLVLAHRQGLVLGPHTAGESRLWQAYTSELRELGRRRLPAALDGYRRLARALERWPSGRRQIEQLAQRQDGVGYQACLVLARSHGDNREEYYRRALDLRPDPGVREELARFLEETGRMPAALAEWKLLLPAGVALEALERLLPDPIAVARMLNDRGMADRALEILRARGEGEARENPAAAREWGRALLARGEARTGLYWLAVYMRAHPDDMETLPTYALALERSGKLTKAGEAYARLGPAGARGLGRVLERQGLLREAAAAYLQSPDPEARWQGARLWEQLGAPDRALEVYRDLADPQQPESGQLKDDASLRAYLLYRRSGQQKEAEEYLARVSPGLAWCAGLHPLAQPSVHPAEQPSRPGPARLLPYETVPDPSSMPPAAVAARALQSLPGIRGASLAQVEMEILGRKGGPQGKLALAQWYAERGNVTLAVEAAMAALAGIPAPSTYRLAYPLPFVELVDEVASDYGVDPLLVWAVMREESHFAPWAVSPAGACGLMQLMPATAAGAARSLGITLREEDLLRPEINLRLGTWYLSRMIAACGGDVVQALAAYNGGLANVHRWAASPVFRGREGFPAAISYPETREYVTKVAASYLVYRYMYGE